MRRRIKPVLCFAFATVMALSTLGIAETDMLAVDHRLYELGYRDENCSGVLNAKMETALKNFQYVNGLKVNGEADDETVNLILNGSPTSKHAYLAGLAQTYGTAEQLVNGDYGDAVARMQRKLKDLGYFSRSSDGAFGDATAAAVMQFQTANGLPANGIADGRTLMRLYEGTPITLDSFLQSVSVAVGDSGAGVRNVQRRLKALGYFTGESTGNFGDGTQQAVKQFQQRNGLEDTGDVDADSAMRLFSNEAVENGAAGINRRIGFGEAVAQMNERLKELGYPTGEGYDTQTQIALMEFQLINGMPLSGVADSATCQRMKAEDAVPLSTSDWKNINLIANEETRARILKFAIAMLGQKLDFVSDFEFVQYVLLSCSVPLIGSEQVRLQQIESASALAGGGVVQFESEGLLHNGIATADGAVIYLSDGGYIVMSYFQALGERNLSVWTMEETT